MRRILPLLVVGVASACGQPRTPNAPSRPENAMNLVVDAKVSEEGDEIVVARSIRNAGTAPVKILLEFMYHRTFAVLRDAQGREVPPDHNAAAARGFRMMSDDPKVRLLQPGESERVESLILSKSRKSASAGDLSWEAESVPAGTLTVELGYEVVQEWADQAARNGAPGVAVGRWTSTPVTLRSPK
jgi:hypothetical protein